MATSSRRKLIYSLCIAFIILAIGLFSAVSFYRWWKNRPPSMNPLHAFPHQEIRIGVDASFPPFGVDNGESLYGIDIDLGNAVASEIGLPVRFVNIGFDALYDAIITDQVDMVISALRIDLTRTAEVRYTQHYFDAGLVLVTPADSPITMMEFMEGYRIAYEFGSIAEAEIRDWERRIGHMIHMPYELPDYALDAVRLDLTDATLVDATSYRLYQREHPNWGNQHRFITNEFYAIALRIDRISAWKLVNNSLDALKKRGELDRIIAEWL